VLKISFAYVKNELQALGENNPLATSLITKIDALEHASHRYWPWNYGSQHKLHTILQEIIHLKQTPGALDDIQLARVLTM